MPLNIPANFENDIESRDTNLVPLVVLGKYNSTNNIIENPNLWLSTNSFTYIHSGANKPILPLLLNIPSLKESIDIETRRYKISSVNLDISNFPYSGKRFSDLLDDTSLINTECRIYWTSPSTSHLPIAGNIEDYSYFPIYYGSIRKYDMTDEKVRLVVEDRSQATLHKDLPLANLGTGGDIPDAGKPIPMVYGEVDRSPLVFKSKDTLLVDTDDLPATSFEPLISPSGFGYDENPLWLYSGDNYINVIQANQYTLNRASAEFKLSTSNENMFGVTESGQESDSLFLVCRDRSSNFSITLSNILEYPPSGFPDVSTENFDLPAGSLMRTIDGKELDNPVAWLGSRNQIIADVWGSVESTELQNTLIVMYDNNNGTLNFDFRVIYGVGFSANNFATPLEFLLLTLGFNFIPSYDHNGYPKLIGFSINGNAVTDQMPFNTEVHRVLQTHDNITPAGGSASDPIGGLSELYSGYPTFLDEEDSDVLFNWLNFKDTDGATGNTNASAAFQISTSITHDESTITASLDLDGSNVKEIELLREVEVEKFLDYKYYANIKGRDIVKDAAGTITGDPRMATMQIWDIVRNELGYLKNWDTEINGAVHSQLYNNSYFTDFTVHKKINSKKLIENLASATQLIPRFDNMGNFKFSFIPIDGQPLSGEVQRIEENDVIDFSFSRTSIDDVYSKIILKYNWDYAREEFNDSIVADIKNVGIVPNYSFDYYGLPDDHLDSTLVIDGEQGKYIRNETTASDFAYWYLLWSCNQHLKMKIKLPLKHIDLEVGDFVDFDAILGGVKPYGIDYISDNERVNDHQVFKNFLITDTNKNLEFVEISCIQMHNLNFSCNYDCTGVCGGTFVEDECGVCDSYSGTGGVKPDFPYGICDCAGVPNGNLVNVGCGCGVAIGELNCEFDCNDDFLGSAFIDGCGVCSGGNSGHVANSDKDVCGVCFGSGWGTCGDGDCTHYDCTPCEGCLDFNGINYNGGACRDTESQGNCLFPQENLDYCPIPELQADWDVPYTNYICNFIPERCDGEESGVFNMSSYATTDLMNQAIHDYCINNPDNCNAADELNIHSNYPLVLKESDCIVPVNELVAIKAELVFYDKGTIPEIEIQKYLIWTKEGIGNELTYQLLCPNGNPCGIPSFWDRTTNIVIRITYNTAGVYGADQGIVSTINGQINMQTGGGEFTNNCTVENEDFWNAFDVNESPYEATLNASTNETVIEHEIKIDDFLGYPSNFSNYYCGVGDAYKVHKFRINLQSSVDVEINGGYVTVETGDVYLNLIEGTPQLVGDADCNGVVELADADLIWACANAPDSLGISCEEYCASLGNDCCYHNMDTTGDTGINSTDAVAIYTCIANGDCSGLGGG